MSILDVVGEVAEFGGGASLVPASLYPVRLHVEGVDVTDSGTPYAELAGTVIEGPFKGEVVSSRYWMSFGKPTSKGGIIPLLASAARVNSGRAADEAVFGEFGFQAPQVTGDPKEDGIAARAALRDLYNELTSADRLTMVTRFLRVSNWDGKTVVASIGLRSYEDNDGNTRHNNEWKGFYPLEHPEKGLTYVRAVSFKDQELEKAAA